MVAAAATPATEVEIPDFPYGALTGTIIISEAATIFEDLIRSGKVDQLADKMQIAGLKSGLEIPATYYLKAMRIRRMIQQEFSRLFAEVDVLLAPGRTGPAPRADQRLDAPGMVVPPGTPAGFQGIIQAGNLAGLPALVLPCGFAENMPVALQLVGAPFSENILLAIGREFQSHTDWHKRRPPS